MWILCKSLGWVDLRATEYEGNLALLIKNPQNVCESVGEGSHYDADRAIVPELLVLFNSRPGRPIVSGIRQLVWPQLRWTMLAKTEQGCSYLKQNDHTSLHGARGKIITAAGCVQFFDLESMQKTSPAENIGRLSRVIKILSCPSLLKCKHKQI